MPDFKGRIVVVDVETGGLSPDKNPITDIAAVVVDPYTDSVIETYQSFIKPYMPSDTYMKKAMELTGLSISFLEENGKDVGEVMSEVVDLLIRNTVKVPRRTLKPIIAGHNVDFDIGFIDKTIDEHVNKDLYDMIDPFIICTMKLMQIGFPKADMIENHKLDSCCKVYNIEIDGAHGALPDTVATAGLLMNLLSFNKVSSGGGDTAIVGGGSNEFRKSFRF